MIKLGYIKYYGHSAFEISLSNKTILIDPWLNNNPLSPCKASDIKTCDIVLVTHDHMDHFGDAIEILKNTNATFVGIYEIAQEVMKRGIKKCISMNIGGVVTIDDLSIIIVPATHSSIKGAPIGYILKGKEATIYHAGDTGIVYEMIAYSKLYPIDVALLPIGSTFTMDPLQAAYFTSLINPKVVIPMHYNTFPVIKQDPKIFEDYVRKYAPEVNVVILKPGEVWKI